MKIRFRKINQLGFLSLHTIVPLVVAVVVIGGIGSYVLSKSKAETPAAVGNGYYINNPGWYYTGTGLTIQDPSSTNTSKLRLYYASGAELANKSYFEKIAISPDGTKIFFQLRDFVAGTDDYFTVAAVASIKGTGFTVIQKTTNTTNLYNSPRWSPDSSMVAWSSWYSSGLGESKLFIAAAVGTLLSSTVQPVELSGALLAWSPSSAKIFNNTDNGADSIFDVATKQFSQVTYTDRGAYTSTNVIGYLDEDTVVLHGYRYEPNPAEIFKINVVTGEKTHIESLNSTSIRPNMSNDKQWLATGDYGTGGAMKIINISTPKTMSFSSGCPGSTHLPFFSPDSLKLYFTCYNSSASDITKVYNLASGAITTAPQAVFGGDFDDNLWQPAAAKVTTKSCKSGTYTMTSNVTWKGLSAGTRVIDQVYMSSGLPSGATNTKKIDYTVKTQSLKNGVWTDVKVYGPKTASAAGTYSFNPANPSENGFSTSRVVVTAGIDGDGAAGCQVIHTL